MSNIYSSVFLIKEGIEQNGVEVDKISKWMLGLSHWPEISNDLTFDKNGDPLAKFYILRIKNGNVKRIDVITPLER